MRCFVAVDVPDSMKADIRELQGKLLGKGVKPVEKENLHYTLKFLGEIGENAVRKTETVLASVAAEFSPFKVAVKGVGAFPDLTYARVIWIGGQELYELQKAVNKGLPGICEEPLPKGSGSYIQHSTLPPFEKQWNARFQRERTIKPHLTIARVKFMDDKDGIAQFVKENRGTEVGTFEVDEFKLKMSTLAREGPVYEDVRVFKLGSP